MKIILALMGIALSVVMLRYRERIGELIGEAPWMTKVGGVYNVVIIFAVLLFFWSISYMTGTLNFFLMPVLWLLPGARQNAGNDVMFN